MQFIIISLKCEIYSYADVLIGVCSDVSLYFIYVSFFNAFLSILWKIIIYIYIFILIKMYYFTFLDYWGIPRKFSIYTFIGKISFNAWRIIFIS